MNIHHSALEYGIVTHRCVALLRVTKEAQSHDTDPV